MEDELRDMKMPDLVDRLEYLSEQWEAPTARELLPYMLEIARRLWRHDCGKDIEWGS